MPISRDEVLHVSRLARLDLGEEELEKFTGQLGAILDHISKLNELSTEGVPPTAHVLDLHNIFREDKAADPPIEGIEKMAPAFAKGHFLVPKVIE